MRSKKHSLKSRLKARFSGNFSKAAIARGLIIMAIAITLAFFAGRYSAVSALDKKNPAMALKIDASNANALAFQAVAYANDGKLDLAQKYARRALTKQAVLPTALGVMALFAYSEGQDDKADSFTNLSNKLSRRDEMTYSIALERAKERGDIKAILRNYDIALRTEPDLVPTLGDPLGQAMHLPEFAEHMPGIIKNRPPWLEEVLSLAISKSEKPEALSDMLVRSGRLPPSKTRAGVEQQLMRQLEYRQKWAALHRFFRYIPENKPAILTNAAFTKETIDERISPLSWTASPDARIEGQFFQPAGKSVTKLSGVALSGTRGLLARKILYLQPGAYNFSIQVTNFETEGGAQAWIEMRCNDGAAHTSIHMELLRPGKNAGRFSVGSQCLAQYVELGLAGGDSPDGAEILMEDMRISVAQ